MKKLILLCASVAILASCKRSNTPFNDLRKIEGQWSMKFDGSEVMERWIKINDTLLQGSSYEITGNDSLLTESVQLVERGNEIFYIPTVSGQNDGKPVMFRLTSSQNNRFVFENPAHNFPTSIYYEFAGNDNLKAGISGIINGEKRSIDFDYERTK